MYISMPFLSYYYFLFIDRHCYFRLSAASHNVGTSSNESGMAENVEVAVEMSLLTRSVFEL